MYRTQNEMKSLRRTLHAESGEAVLALSIQYGSSGVLFEITPLDRTYMQSHREETAAAVGAFLEDANLLLAGEKLPEIRE